MNDSFTFVLQGAHAEQMSTQFLTWGLCLLVGFLAYLLYFLFRYGRPNNLIGIFFRSLLFMIVCPPWTTVGGYKFSAYYAMRRVCHTLDQEAQSQLPQRLQEGDRLIWYAPRKDLETDNSFWYLRGLSFRRADMALTQEGLNYRVTVNSAAHEEGTFDRLWLLEQDVTEVQQIERRYASLAGQQVSLSAAVKQQHQWCQLYRIKGTDRFVAHFYVQDRAYLGLLQGERPRWVFAPYYVNPELLDFI